jgi:phosphatidylserine/phosphatidylglycerophosphate/cardiolipin synthase-like enzyme
MERFPKGSVTILILLGLFLINCVEDTSLCDEVRFISNRDYYPAFHRLAEGASESIFVVIYLAKFHKTQETQVNMILDDLIFAKQRGLLVRVLLERSSWDSTLNKYNREFIDSLLRYEIIASFDGEATTTHAKCVVFDGECALLGSSNWSTSALEYNNEVNIEIHDKKICGEIEEYINNLWEDK